MNREELARKIAEAAIHWIPLLGGNSTTQELATILLPLLPEDSGWTSGPRCPKCGSLEIRLEWMSGGNIFDIFCTCGFSLTSEYVSSLSDFVQFFSASSGGGDGWKERAEKAEVSRKHTQQWYARHYGKLEDWARKILPEPWRTQFFSCVANGLWDCIKDVGKSYISVGCGEVTPSGYFVLDSAQAQLLYDQTGRAEKAEAELIALKSAGESRTSTEAYSECSDEAVEHLNVIENADYEEASAAIFELRKLLPNVDRFIRHEIEDALKSAGDGWVRCAERLPPMNLEVLVHGCSEQTMCAFRQMAGTSWIWIWFNGKGSSHHPQLDITHWRPLPPAPAKIHKPCTKPLIPGPVDIPCCLTDGHEGICRPAPAKYSK